MVALHTVDSLSHGLEHPHVKWATRLIEKDFLHGLFSGSVDTTKSFMTLCHNGCINLLVLGITIALDLALGDTIGLKLASNA